MTSSTDRAAAVSAAVCRFIIPPLDVSQMQNDRYSNEKITKWRHGIDVTHLGRRQTEKILNK